MPAFRVEAKDPVLTRNPSARRFGVLRIIHPKIQIINVMSIAAIAKNAVDIIKASGHFISFTLENAAAPADSERA